jgi:nicotinamidase-related amidase
MNGRALIIVDLQRGFLNRHTRHIRRRIERFQHQFQHVVVTQYYRRPDALMVRLLGIDGYEKGSREAELAFQPRDGALTIDKTRYSCVDDDLVRRLRVWGIREAYICGVDTDQCVFMIAADLLQNDIVPIVCENLTASAAGPEFHEAALFLLRRLIGREQVRRVR